MSKVWFCIKIWKNKKAVNLPNHYACLEADHPRKHTPILVLEIMQNLLLVHPITQAIQLLSSIHFDSLKANYKHEGEVMDENGEAEDEEKEVKGCLHS